MHKSDSQNKQYNQENIDPNIIRRSAFQKSADRYWSANTGDLSNPTSDDIEISCFHIGPTKLSILNQNQALLAQLQLEEYLTSNSVPDTISYLDEFEDLDWLKHHYLIHLIEMIAKQPKEHIAQRIVQLTKLITQKHYLLSRPLIKLIFSVSARIGSHEGVYALTEIDSAMNDMITEMESSEATTAFNQVQFLPLILYSHAHQLLYWQLPGECWAMLQERLPIRIESIKEEWEKTAQKICDLLLRQLVEMVSQNEVWGTLIKEVLYKGVATLRPSDIFFNKLIDYAFRKKEVRVAEMLFEFMRDTAKIQPTIVTINTMIDQYFKNGFKEKAWQTFEILKQTSTKPDNFTYTTLINGLKNNKEGMDLRLAFQLFDEYKLLNAPDQIIYNCLLDACINAGDLQRGFLLLQEMKSSPNIQLDEITYNTLIKGCGRKKRLNDALSLFEEMKQMGIRPNRISFNSLLDSCVKCNKMNVAWRYFEEMRKQYGIFPDNFTYSILVNGIKTNHSNRDELLRAISLLEQIQETGQFRPDEILYNSLIDACVKFNEIQKGMELFDEMRQKHIEPSSVTYGILIKAHGKINDLKGAFRMFEDMKHKRIPINDVTYGCLVDACVRNDRLDKALEFIEQMKQEGLAVNTVLYTTVIKGFCKLNQTDEALKYFSMMKTSPKTYPNLITYNSMLDGLVKNNQLAEADRLFSELIDQPNIRPDLITFSTLLKGHCRKGNMKRVNEAVHTMIMHQIVPDESLLQLILEACLNQSQYMVGVQIYDQFCHHLPQSSQLLLQALRLHALSHELPQAVPLLERLHVLLEENRLSHPQLENTINSCLSSNLEEQTLPILTKIVCLGLRNDLSFYSLDALICAENSELALLLQNCTKLNCAKVQSIMGSLEYNAQQLCRQYLRKNSKNDLKEPLNEQFGQVFLNCNKKKTERSSPFNNENKENYNRKQRNETSEYAVYSRKKC